MFERTRPAVALLGALGMAAGATLQAGNFDYQVSAGAAHSDNVNRVAEDGVEENIASAGLRFSFDEQTRKLKTDLVGSFDYQKFLDDTYESQLIGNFVGNLTVSFIPDRFSWTVDDNFGQVLADPLLPATPLNSENINFFSTGPDVTFALGAQNRLELAARYLRTDYEDSPFDSTTTLGQVGVGRTLSSVNSLSINARLQSVDFAEPLLSQDYEQTDMFLRFEANGARTRISADAGITELNRDLGEDIDSELLRIEAVRQLSRASTLSLLAGREFANAGTAFADLQGSGPITLDPTAGRQVPAPFERDHASLAWMFELDQTSFSLRAAYEEQNYEFADTLDQELTTFSAFFRRYLSAATDVQLDIARIGGQFALGGAEYTDTNGGLAFNWGVSRNIALSLSYRYSDRDGDAITGDYTENRLWLSISFRRGAPRTEILQPEFPVDAPQN